jgi:hypothetical protein
LAWKKIKNILEAPKSTMAAQFEMAAKIRQKFQNAKFFGFWNKLEKIKKIGAKKLNLLVKTTNHL